MAAIEGTYVSGGQDGYTLVIKNANDNTGKCDVEWFSNEPAEDRLTYKVEAAHYHFEHGDMGWGVKTLLALLATGPDDEQELPFRVIVLRAENKDFKTFTAKETMSTFSKHFVTDEVYTRVHD